MRLLRVGASGAEQPVVIDEDGVARDLRPVAADLDGEFWNGGVARTRRALEAGALPPIDISGRRVGAPVARPSAIWCIGMNYAAHAAESGAEPPAVPIVFLKTPNTLAGPGDDIVIPRTSEATDWEVELALVVGRRAHYLDSPDEARDYIAGYTISNDVSERRFQIEESGGQWSKGKCAPTFNPLGPAVVPADQFEASRVRLRSWVNGETRQDSSTADMIFGPEFLIWHLSQYAALEPGDIVNTGTPQGVGLSRRFPYLAPGDLVDVEIEGLGRLSNRCRAA